MPASAAPALATPPAPAGAVAPRASDGATAWNDARVIETAEVARVSHAPDSNVSAGAFPLPTVPQTCAFGHEGETPASRMTPGAPKRIDL